MVRIQDGMVGWSWWQALPSTSTYTEVVLLYQSGTQHDVTHKQMCSHNACLELEMVLQVPEE